MLQIKQQSPAYFCSLLLSLHRLQASAWHSCESIHSHRHARVPHQLNCCRQGRIRFFNYSLLSFISLHSCWSCSFCLRHWNQRCMWQQARHPDAELDVEITWCHAICCITSNGDWKLTEVQGDGSATNNFPACNWKTAKLHLELQTQEVSTRHSA